MTEEKVSQNQRYKNKLSKVREMNPISQLGAFKPAIPKNHSMNRAGIRAQKSAAKKLYDKRNKIAKNIVIQNNIYKDNNPSSFVPDMDERKVILSKALISSGLSPQSNLGWIEYMTLLVKDSGGWNSYMKKLTYEINKMNYYSGIINQYLIFSLAIAFIIMSLPINSLLHGYKFIFVDASLIIIYFLCAIKVSQPYRLRKNLFTPKKIDDKQRLSKPEVNSLLLSS